MRRGGILLHLSSLPSPGGIGTMGRAARDFVDFLEAAGQSVWQLLPICPTSYGDSPYQSFSTFAGNPYFIDLDALRDDGLLRPSEYESIDWESTPDAVNYSALYEKRYPVLKLACRRLLEAPPPEYAAFCARSGGWLPDYALFMALKEAHGGKPWQEWAEPLRRRENAALRQFRAESSEEIAFWEALQFLFFRQWTALKDYTNAHGVSIIGDLPIYVAEDSAEVWAHPDQFQLDEDLRPTEVAGCPPDGFSREGQLWGNPLFRWDAMERDGYAWWQRRVAYQKQIFDILRIDHFRGLEAYYAIPRGAATAREGRWRKGPGLKLLQGLAATVGIDGIIAEDLGYLDDSVRSLLEESGLPGMKVLQFAFDSRESGDYLPHNYEKHCVVYSGTHDNDTVLGWMENAPARDVATAREYLHLTEEEGLNWGFLRGVWSSVGDLSIVQMQDVLGLPGSCRMNTPSTLGPNWRWRMLPDAASRDVARKLHHQMELYQRLPLRKSMDGNAE